MFKLILIILLTFTANAKEVIYPKLKSIPDIMIQADFSQASQRFLLETAFESLDENGVPLLKQSFPGSMRLNGEMKMNSVKQQVTSMISDMLGADIERSEAKFKLDNFSYQINGWDIQVAGTDANRDGIEFTITVTLKDVVIEAEEITLKFDTHSDQKEILDYITIVLEQPKVEIPSLNSLELNIKAVASFQEDRMKVTLKNSSIEIFKNVTVEDLRNDIVLSFGDNPQIHGIHAISWGGRRVPLKPENVEELLEIRKEKVAELMLKPIVRKFKEVPDLISNSRIGSFSVPRKLSFNKKGVGAELVLSSIGHIDMEQLFVNYDCDISFNGKSVNSESIDYPRQDYKSFSNSISNIRTILEKNESDIVISLGDAFVNKTIVNALAMEGIQAKFPKKLKLGEKQVYYDFTKGKFGMIVGDIHTNLRRVPKFFLKMLTGQNEFHFPLVVYPQFSITKIEGEYHLNIDLSDIDDSDETILNGIDDVSSNIGEVRRFKRLVKRILKKKLKKIKEIEIPPIKLPAELNKFDMRIFSAESDGFGRFNFMFKLSGQTEGNMHFWNKIVDYMPHELLREKITIDLTKLKREE